MPGPYFLGHFIIYAHNLFTAREIYDKLSIGTYVELSGTECLDSGERIHWSSMPTRSDSTDSQKSGEAGN
jgi:hypothetical protein